MVQILNEGSKTVRKKLEILRNAATAFRENGFHGTGMRDIARSMDLAPGALYYYFRSKEELLFFCQDYALDRMLEAAGKIVRRKIGAKQKLQELIQAQMECMLDELQGSAGHLEYPSLPDELLEKIVAKRDRYEGILRKVIEEGIRSRVFRSVDAKLTCRMILGAVNWTVRWYRPDGPNPPGEIADQFGDILIRGLLR